jgi:hypothetical protein
MKKVEKLSYLGKYSKYRNDIVDEKVKEYIDYVLRTDLYNANVFLCKLSEEYKDYSHLYILECICNYIVKIYANVRLDYIYLRDYDNYDILQSLKERYDNVKSVYDLFDRKHDERVCHHTYGQVIDFQQAKRERIRKYS